MADFLLHIFLASGQKRLPSVDDFSIPWVETKPGDPHPKTGIPPTFFTATLSDFLEGGGKMSTSFSFVNLY